MKLPSNERIAKWVTKGTRIKWERVTVLYNDGDWALVKWPSVMLTRHEYCSPWVCQYDLSQISDYCGTPHASQTLWECSRDGDGPMNASNLRKLVKQQRLNEDYICQRGKQTPIWQLKRFKERTVKMTSCTVKVGMFIEGVESGVILGEDCEGALDSFAIVAEIDEIGSPSAGDYIVLMYESTEDFLEFFKGDQEKILDALESLT